MRKTLILLVISFFLILNIDVRAQHELWGMTSLGGGVKGVIFKTDSSGSNFSVEYIFDNFEQNPKGTLIKAANGKYYGMSDNGGLNGLGTIFEYDSSTDSVKIIHNFDGAATGAHPKGSLIQATNGKLYGMTLSGGSVNLGVVFEYDISSATLTKLHDFTDSPDGRNPYGSLMQASNSKLYGMTSAGGSGYFNGTIFEIDLSGPTYAKVYTFGNGSDGAAPLGDLIQASNGKLYGLTSAGGIAGYGNNGTLFEFDIGTATYTMIHDFDGTQGQATGSTPRGSLMQASNGKLYGMTYSGGIGMGVIFEYDITGDTLIKRRNFNYQPDLNHPEYTRLVEGENNVLFGMTSVGGNNNLGGLFRFNVSSGAYEKLLDFTGSLNGNKPYGSLVESSPGKFLGMTSQGGSAGKGLLFEYDTTTATLAATHSFDSYSGGEIPYGSLTAASNGKFYGLTSEGGQNNCGTLFEYDPVTGSYKKLHDFDGSSTGRYPTGSLIEVTEGKLYGMTKHGGSNDQGTLFEFDINTGTFTKLYDFGYAPAAGLPCGSLLRASNGLLYGMTSSGGTHSNWGTLFEYNTGSGSLTVKNNFDNTHGRSPEGSLIETSPGVLYGLTRFGGASNDWGTIFEYDVSGGTLTIRHEFNSTAEGREPKGDLIKASDGMLYGLGSAGGANALGSVFQYDIQEDTLVNVHSFTSTTGRYPYGSLVESSDGKLYGMTGGGTDAGYLGTFFQVDTATNAVSKILDFNGASGSKPQYTQLVRIMVHAVWTGAVSTDWHDPDNWLQHDVPGAFTEVIIPDVSSASGNFPIVSADAKVRSLTVESGAGITIQPGKTLVVLR